MDIYLLNSIIPHNCLWNLKMPPKVKNFVWRSFHNCLPCMDNLRAHHVPVNAACPLCLEAQEDSSHALFMCTRAQDIWSSLGLWEVVGFENISNIQDWWLHICNSASEMNLHRICICSWAIWND